MDVLGFENLSLQLAKLLQAQTLLFELRHQLNLSALVRTASYMVHATMAITKSIFTLVKRRVWAYMPIK